MNDEADHYLEWILNYELAITNDEADHYRKRIRFLK